MKITNFNNLILFFLENQIITLFFQFDNGVELDNNEFQEEAANFMEKNLASCHLGNSPSFPCCCFVFVYHPMLAVVLIELGELFGLAVVYLALSREPLHKDVE
ncbi:MAG: hypothetical protein ACFFCH_02320 [Promethearchaeota archaeon]